MDDLESRLTKCFQTVFPDLSDAVIRATSMETLDAWDSLKMMTLIVVLEEEFAVEIPLDEIENLTSFVSLENFLSLA